MGPRHFAALDVDGDGHEKISLRKSRKIRPRNYELFVQVLARSLAWFDDTHKICNEVVKNHLRDQENLGHKMFMEMDTGRSPEGKQD